MSELPEEFNRRLDENLHRDLRQRTVAEVIHESDEPYLSRTVIQQRVNEKTGESYDKSTVIDRLTELLEQGVLKSDEVCGGQIYWMFDDDSDWPIPPDVETEPVTDEMTVQEFFSSFPVLLGVVGTGLILVASLFMWIGTMLLPNGSEVLILSPEEIITAGFLLIFVGWMFLGAATVAWFRIKPTFNAD